MDDKEIGRWPGHILRIADRPMRKSEYLYPDSLPRGFIDPARRRRHIGGRELFRITRGQLGETAIAFATSIVPAAFIVEALFREGHLYTLTSRTGHGKTSVLLTTAMAVATGRADILGRPVKRSRVFYVAAEQAGDLRERLAATAHHFCCDLADLDDSLVFLSDRLGPEQIFTAISAQSHHDDPVGLVVVDTLAATFDGEDANSSVQAGEFIRRHRILEELPGSPAAVIAAHPVKNASFDNLLPGGSGASLNEIDTNYALWAETPGVSTFHWQGKTRESDFDPIYYAVDMIAAPGRRPQPVAQLISSEDVAAREIVASEHAARTLALVVQRPYTIRALANALDVPYSWAGLLVSQLKDSRLVEPSPGGGWQAASKARGRQSKEEGG